MPIEPKQPTAKGPGDWFTGDVYIARTAWHSHTVGQTLVVTDGLGLHQPRGGIVEQIRAGDVVVVPADVWH